jgi:hypothetical protein
MPLRARRRPRRAARALAIVAIATVALVACKPPTGGVSSSVGTVPVMGQARLTTPQLATWFMSKVPPGYRATVDAWVLIDMFLAEGAAEGVRGDMAFLQGIVETGWYRFTGSVPPGHNNFAGIGATDSGGAPAAFPDARTGVRAQIQHLRAYADPTATTCTVPPLANPCVDPRFHLVSPKGKAPTWNQMGNGNWATSTTYATTILNLYAEALQFHGLSA